MRNAIVLILLSFCLSGCLIPTRKDLDYSNNNYSKIIQEEAASNHYNQYVELPNMNTVTVPEPSTMYLTLLGLPFLWRRRNT